MLRPILAFLTLCIAAFLLAPTVSSVHAKVAELDIQRDLSFELFKWTDEPKPGIPGCGFKRYQLFAEITKWPDRIEKDQIAYVEGKVETTDEVRPVQDVEVDIYINHTKELPGELWATAYSQADGKFSISALVPFELPAAHYHIVAHAKERSELCTIYLEFWTDPETDVVSSTSVRPLYPERVIAGYNTTFTGHVMDAVDVPVGGANVTVKVDGRTYYANTSPNGEWSVTFAPKSPGELRINASFNGSRYYRPSFNVTTLEVLSEDASLPALLEMDRSAHTTFAGVVYPPHGAAKSPVTIRFEGVRLATCAGCAPTDSLSVPYDATGAFSVELYAPYEQAPGPFRVAVSGAGLRETYRTNGTLYVPTTLHVEPEAGGLFDKRFGGTVTLRDDAGKPLAAPVTVSGPGTTLRNATDAQGTYVFAAKGPECGRGEVVAEYAGGDHVRPSFDSAPVLVCGYLAYIPAWLAAVPWWGWLLGVLGAGLAYILFPRVRERYATTIAGGPALTLVATEPSDAAAGIGGVGETLGVTAFLEAPLPDGHRLRIGPPGAMEEAVLDAELRARWRFVPDRTGDFVVRADVQDARGRVVSRRTVTLHAVRYAQEIERRYLALRKAGGLHEAVSPREFEAWLRQRAPEIDAAVARSLVAVFEEADYAPREAGRREFLEYVAAEAALPEVRPSAVV